MLPYGFTGVPIRRSPPLVTGDAVVVDEQDRGAGLATDVHRRVGVDVAGEPHLTLDPVGHVAGPGGVELRVVVADRPQQDRVAGRVAGLVDQRALVLPEGALRV